MTLIFVVSFLFLAAIAGTGIASEKETRSRLDGLIVRSLSVDSADSSRVLVGRKGSAPGSAQVFESRDRGQTWRVLNGGRPLSRQATDVQAVAAIGNDIVLAGTWKYGLYISTDKGQRFFRVAGFPSDDIRDLHVSAQQGVPAVYAATARDGIFLSTDFGKTWKPLGPSRDFFWSVTASGDGSAVYAVSLEGATFAKKRAAGAWRKIFDRDDAYGLASNRDGATLAIAAQTGAYLTKDVGKRWQPIEALNGEKLSDVVFLDKNTAVFGSWADGLARLDLRSGEVKRFLSGVPVVHVAVADDVVLVGTWGEGLKILPFSALMK